MLNDFYFLEELLFFKALLSISKLFFSLRVFFKEEEFSVFPWVKAVAAPPWSTPRAF